MKDCDFHLEESHLACHEQPSGGRGPPGEKGNIRSTATGGSLQAGPLAPGSCQMAAASSDTMSQNQPAKLDSGPTGTVRQQAFVVLSP